jgi:hypothetical protein
MIIVLDSGASGRYLLIENEQQKQLLAVFLRML